MYLGKDTEKETFVFNNFILNNSNEEKILGTTTDNKLTFKSHIKISCKKAEEKIGPLSRLLNHKRLIFNFIIKSQCNYCPPIWMLWSGTSNNMIHKIHERAPRLMLNDHSIQLFLINCYKTIMILVITIEASKLWRLRSIK